jgi:hypothetical protein
MVCIDSPETCTSGQRRARVSRVGVEKNTMMVVVSGKEARKDGRDCQKTGQQNRGWKRGLGEVVKCQVSFPAERYLQATNGTVLVFMMIGIVAASRTPKRYG